MSISISPWPKHCFGVPSPLRRLLHTTLIAEGFAPYPLEWWHWSIGDGGWADFYNRP